MLQICRPTILVLTIGLMGNSSVGVSQEKNLPDNGEAGKIFARFLERLAGDAPVAGEFEIQGTISKQALVDHVAAAKADAAQRGLGVVAPEASPVLRCRWAWDGKREMLEALPSSNVFETFLSTPDSILEGLVERNYNLSAPKLPYPVRPASFYFLLGTKPWPLVGTDATVELDEGDAPDGTRALRLIMPVGRARLFIREVDFRHQGHELYLDEKLFHRMEITQFVENPDGRAFPREARLEVFHPQSGDLLRVDALQVVKAVFPGGTAEMDAAFSMNLPAGAEVHDLLLNKELVLSRETSALDVMQGKWTVDGRPWTKRNRHGFRCRHRGRTANDG